MSAMEVDCSPGIFDCQFDNTGDQCANFNGELPEPNTLTWIVPISAIFMCANAFGIGANDVANAWGSSVGSGAITMRKACLIAGFMNILGAVTLGYGVSDTIQKGVAEVTSSRCWACGYCNSKMTLYAVGMFSALIGSSAFNLLATFGSLPVSGIYMYISVSTACVDWSMAGLGGIIISWVLSPLLAGLIGAALYVGTDRLIMRSTSPRARALTFMPWFVALSSFLMCFLVLIKSKVTHKALPIWAHFLLSLVLGLIGWCGGWYYRWRYVEGFLPSQQDPIFLETLPGGRKDVKNKRIEEAEDERSIEVPSSSNIEKDVADIGDLPSKVEGISSELQPVDDGIEEADMQGGERKMDTKSSLETESTTVNKDIQPVDVELGSKRSSEVKDATYVFKYLIVFNAALESFAHGSNDTGNSTAPFSAVLQTHEEGIHECSKARTPEWVLLVAGVCVALGVNTLGYRVMEVVGKKITIINFHQGFCMEFASTAAVVVATLFQMPVSTTHCQIGAVTAVGLVSNGYKNVKFSMLGQIVLSWIITLPFAGLTAAAFLSMIGTGL
ncbi:hypothetical protein AAMO2058_000615300 [Amorphochlora amoebiformis]